MFVNMPRRQKPHWRWATPLLAVLMTATLAWIALLPDDAAWRATLLRWGTLSGSVTEWRGALHDGRLLTLVSALFIHLGPVHLVGNLLFLMIFGLPAERALGSWRFLALFLVGGAIANLTGALTIASANEPIVGSSGGVSAVVGAYLALFPRARLGLVLPLGLFLEFVRIPAPLLIGFWILLQVLFTFVGPSFGAVVWWTHIAGFLIGIVFALIARPAIARRLRG